MTIIESENKDAEKAEKSDKPRVGAVAPQIEPQPGHVQDSKNEKESDKGMFSEKNISEDSEVSVASKPAKDLDLGHMQRKVTITPADKKAFIDAVVGNTRYTRDYSLFGGRVKLTVRSLTSDETNALATWTARQGTTDPSGMFAGRYRKYLMAAQIARLDGVDMPPLEEPLFEKLSQDGKTVEEPGWIKRSAYFDGMGVGKFNAIMGCLADFDLVYSMLCKEADNANFWDPDTP